MPGGSIRTGEQLGTGGFNVNRRSNRELREHVRETNDLNRG